LSRERPIIFINVLPAGRKSAFLKEKAGLRYAVPNAALHLSKKAKEEYRRKAG